MCLKIAGSECLVVGCSSCNGAKRPLRPSVQIISVTFLLEIDKKESGPKKKGDRKVKRGYHAGVDFPFYQIRRGRKIEREERKTKKRMRGNGEVGEEEQKG